jgi:hypothetical protein
MKPVPVIRLVCVCLTLFAHSFLGGCSEVYSTRRILCGLEGDDVDSISVYVFRSNDDNTTDVWKAGFELSRTGIDRTDRKALDTLLERICDLEADIDLDTIRGDEIDSVELVYCLLQIQFNDQNDGMNISQGSLGVCTQAWPGPNSRILGVVPAYYNRTIPYSLKVCYSTRTAGLVLLNGIRSILSNHGHESLADSLITQQRRIPNPAKRNRN